MFWGLIMEPGRCYTQTVKVPFHVSMAALDISNSGDQPAQVMCVFEGRNYLLCTLNNKEKVQCVLDLNFEAGTKVSFATNGKSHVHLTGYLTAFDDESDQEEEEVEEEQVLTKKQKKRLQQLTVEEPPKKKLKAGKVSLESLIGEEAEEEESSDSDFDIDKLMEPADDSDGDAEEASAEEDEADDDDDAEGEEEDEESSMSEEEEEVFEKPKQNGVSKKLVPTPSKLSKKEQEKTPKDKQKNQQLKDDKQQTQQKTPKGKKQILKGGVIVEDLREGSGNVAKPGKFVHVYYEGRLKGNNKLFDSTTKGPGFSFRIGKGEVVKGWDAGVVGMKVGGKRRLICPPNAAYGSKGSPPVIPPNSTLVFDIELKKVN